MFVEECPWSINISLTFQSQNKMSQKRDNAAKMNSENSIITEWDPLLSKTPYREKKPWQPTIIKDRRPSKNGRKNEGMSNELGYMYRKNHIHFPPLAKSGESSVSRT